MIRAGCGCSYTAKPFQTAPSAGKPQHYKLFTMFSQPIKNNHLFPKFNPSSNDDDVTWVSYSFFAEEQKKVHTFNKEELSIAYKGIILY